MNRFIALICSVILCFGICAQAKSPLEQEALREEDFEYTYDGTRLVYNSAMYGYARKGYLKTEEVDSEHGASLKIGMAEAPTQGETSSPYIVVSQKADTNLTVGFSFYLSGTADYRMAVYRAAQGAEPSKEINIIRWQDSLNTGAEDFLYEKNRWYEAVVEFDFVNGNYSVALDGETIVDKYKFTDVSKIDSIRFYGHTSASKVGFIALDDIMMSIKAPPPVISEMGYDGEKSTAIPADCKTLEFYLNTPMYKIAQEQTHLYMNGREIKYNRMGYDSEKGIIVLDVDGTLNPNMQYEIIIDAEAEIFKDTPLGEKISYTFTTAADGAALVSAEFLKNGDDALSINALFVNTQGSEKTLFVAAAVWNGDEFIRLIVFDGQIAKGGEMKTYTADGIREGERVELYVWDSMFGGEFLAKRLYTYDF